MAYVSFENLAVYQLAEKLADHTWTIVARWQPFEREMLGSALIKAADSISLNIVSGHGCEPVLERQSLARQACISYNQTRHWLRRAYKRRLLSSQEIRILGPIVRELGIALNAYLQAVSAQAVSAQAVSAQAMTAQALTAQAVSAQAISAQAASSSLSPQIRHRTLRSDDHQD